MRSSSRFVAFAILGLSTFGLSRSAKADIVPGSEPDVLPPPQVIIVDHSMDDEDHSDRDRARGEKNTSPPTTSFVRGFGAVGASNGGVYGIRNNAVHLSFGLTIDHRTPEGEAMLSPSLAVPLSLEIDTGESANGLKLTDAALTFALQAVIGRVRIGGGLSLSHVWISRPGVGRTIGASGAGAFALASVDVLAFEKDRAIFIGARPQLDWRFGDLDIKEGAPSWRIAGVIGARF